MGVGETILNEVGLPVRQGGSLLDPPVIIVYGRQGAGKSTEMAKSFPDAYWITTHNTVLRPFESWLRDYSTTAAGYGITRPPDRYVLRLFDEATRKAIDPRKAFDMILNQITTLVRQGRFPYSGVVIDEMTYLSLHVAAQIPRTMGWGKVDVVKEWHHELAAWARNLNILMGWVCHEDEPKTTEKGAWYPGGPALAIGTLRKEVGQLADVIVRLIAEQVKTVEGVDAIKAAMKGDDKKEESQASTPDVAEEGDVALIGEDGIRRFFVCGVRDDWVTKVRDFSIKVEEPMNLRGMLVRAGYPINQLRAV